MQAGAHDRAPVRRAAARGAPAQRRAHRELRRRGADVTLGEALPDGASWCAKAPRRSRLWPSFTQAHNRRNLLAAVAAARALGYTPGGPLRVSFSEMRGQRAALPGGGVLIDDSYNANPMSMRAALEDLAATAQRRRVAVLGEMLELGPERAGAAPRDRALRGRAGGRAAGRGGSARRGDGRCVRRRGARGGRRRRAPSRCSQDCSRPATRCSSRPPAASAWSASRRRSARELQRRRRRGRAEWDASSSAAWPRC